MCVSGKQCGRENTGESNILSGFIVFFDKAENWGFREGKPLQFSLIKIEYITELS